MDDAARQRLIQLLGMTGSAFDGEAVTALRLAQKLMREHRVTWEEMTVAAGNLQHQLDIATDACRQLQIENEELRANLARAARAAVNGAAGPAAALLGDHAKQAQWLLGLHAEGEIRLSRFEHDFCESISGWAGDLTPKQKPIFTRILGNVCRGTGKTPPP
jgi:Protein of unknown function (DUF2786)